MAEGTKEDPWELRTAPGTSAYSMWKDEAADPPTLVRQVGSTQLKYQLRAIDDLHAWLVERGDWADVGAADEQKLAADGTVEAWAACRTTRWAAGTASARATGAGSACTAPLLEALGKAELTHEKRNNKVRALP